MINSDANVHVYETIASQQPAQLQSIAGSGQVSVKGNYQPLYFGRNIHPHQGYFQDPTKMAYATLPMQPYPISSMPPQLYGGNCIITPQQVCNPIHAVVSNISYISSILVTDVFKISRSLWSNSSQPQSQLVQLSEHLLEITISLCLF